MILEIKFQYLWKTKTIKIRYLLFGKNGIKENINTKTLAFGGIAAKTLSKE